MRSWSFTAWTASLLIAACFMLVQFVSRPVSYGNPPSFVATGYGYPFLAAHATRYGFRGRYVGKANGVLIPSVRWLALLANMAIGFLLPWAVGTGCEWLLRKEDAQQARMAFFQLHLGTLMGLALAVGGGLIGALWLVEEGNIPTPLLAILGVFCAVACMSLIVSKRLPKYFETKGPTQAANPTVTVVETYPKQRWRGTRRGGDGGDEHSA